MSNFARGLDARTRMATALALLAAGLLVPAGWPLLLYLLMLLGLAVGLGTGRRLALFALRLILPTTLMLLVVYGLLVPPPAEAEPFPLLGVRVSAAGVAHGLSVAGRLLAVGATAVAFAGCTPPMDLAHGLRRLGVPAALTAMVVSSFNLSGLTVRRVHQITEAQRSRGVWPRGLIVERAHVLVAVLRPLLFGLLLGALERSALWQSRGYLRLPAGPADGRPWCDRAVLFLAFLLLFCTVLSRWLV